MTLYYIIVILGLCGAEFIRLRGDGRALRAWCVLYCAAGVLAGLWIGGVSF
ncbi:MAG: hypothetical protein IJY86_05595 [Clostridia bacterium]|nr:hypothetical protein [Clostridia bacterium]